MIDDDYQNPEWEYETAFGFGENLIVFRRCPKCRRFIKAGEAVLEYEDGRVAFVGWRCCRCGPIEPEWTRVS